MLVRLLVAVLMLVGPLPVRVCTCAAAAAQTCPPSVTPAAPEPERCGCRSGAEPADHAEPQLAVGARTSDAGGHSHPDRHDRDCPAVNPAPVQSTATPAPTLDAPADAGPCPPPRVEPSVVTRSRAASRSAPRPVVGTVPLYISLLSIRV